VNDLLDAFPTDPNESVDTDLDTIGNNADTDDDGDTILDTDEKEMGSNPLAMDSDGDGVLDSREKELGTNLAVSDTDADGALDGEDDEPLTPNKFFFAPGEDMVKRIVQFGVLFCFLVSIAFFALSRKRRTF
jgi:hypothetical protein